MARVITSISFDLKFNVLDTPPVITVGFTDVSPGGQESHGKVTLSDAEAAGVLPPGLLAVVNTALDTKAAALPDLPTIAARMTAVDDLDRQIATKRAQVDAADAELSAKRAEVAALAVEPAAEVQGPK